MNSVHLVRPGVTLGDCHAMPAGDQLLVSSSDLQGTRVTGTLLMAHDTV